MQIVPFKEKNISKEILKDLEGKRFFAIVIDDVGTNERNYSYVLSESMCSEQIVYAANYLIRKIIEEDMERHEC